VYCWAAAPLTVTNSNPAVTVAVETPDAAIARIICTFMAYLPTADSRVRLSALRSFHSQPEHYADRAPAAVHLVASLDRFTSRSMPRR
jgi:hypothetical protein